MPDYKKMYLTMVDAVAKAMTVMIEAEQKCEDIYVSTGEPLLIELPKETKTEKT